MSPCPPDSTLTLEELVKRRDQLVRVMSSGVLEIDQPALGRTQYRTLDEVAAALRVVNGMILALCPAADDPNVEMRRRRPIYPVVTEW